MSAADTESPRRRIPKQARARERVGSVYQFFSSKNALLLAAAETVMDEADSETARQLAECRGLPWREAVDRTVSATLGFFGESPDYRPLLRTIRFTTEFAEVTAASNERVADLMSLHPAFGRAGISRAKALETCRTVVTAGNALQDRAPVDERPDFLALLEEKQRLVKGYLGTYLP